MSLSQLHMKPAEGALYEQLFRFCDPSGSQLVTGSAVKPLFSKSKLNNKILAGIWTLADKGKRKALDMENWSTHAHSHSHSPSSTQHSTTQPRTAPPCPAPVCHSCAWYGSLTRPFLHVCCTCVVLRAVALRLIALAQSGLPVSELGLKQYTDVPLPVFEGLQLSQPQPIQQPPQPSQQQQQQANGMVGAGPPDMSSFPAPSSAPPAAASSATSTSQSSEWSMSSEERVQYVSQFSSADEDQDGFVGGKEAQHFFQRSGLDKKSLRQIWLLADYDKDNKLSVDEFAIAMHLVLKQRKGVALPAQLPEALIPSRRSSAAASSAGPDMFASIGGSDTPPSLGFSAAQSGGGFGSFGESGSSSAPTPASAPPAMAAPLQPTNFFPNGSAAAFLATPEDEMDKYRDLTRIASTAQSSVHRAADQLKGLQDVLSNYTGKFRQMMEQVAKTGADYDNLQMLIAEEQAKIDKCKAEMAKLDEDSGGVLTNVERARQQLVEKQLEYKDVQQQILQATQSIPSIKKETQELDMQIAIVEAQLTQVRQQWKQAEDMKVTRTATHSDPH